MARVVAPNAFGVMPTEFGRTRLDAGVTDPGYGLFANAKISTARYIAVSILNLAPMKTGIPNSVEIERKFLLKQLPEKLNRSRRYIIAQGYLATEPAGRQVRLRKKGKIASLTFKVGRGAHREEREIKLSPKQFAALWPATAGKRLRKLRYEIPWKDVLIEIDIYRGRHVGLVVAEVEFPDRAMCRKFKPPSWFGREVTGEKRYSNVRLANE